MAEKIIDNPDIIEIGRNIQKCRKKKGLSQNKLADRVNVAGNSMHRMEAATVVMGVDKLLAISDALEVSPNELLPDRFQKSEKGTKKNQELDNNLQLWSKLTDANKNIVMTMMKMLAEQQTQL